MEKIVLRYRKKGYTQTQLEAAALAFAQAKGLSDSNMIVYNDYEEIAVFGTDKDGNKVEQSLPFAKLEKWVKEEGSFFRNIGRERPRRWCGCFTIRSMGSVWGIIPRSRSMSGPTAPPIRSGGSSPFWGGKFWLPGWTVKSWDLPIGRETIWTGCTSIRIISEKELPAPCAMGWNRVPKGRA